MKCVGRGPHSSVRATTPVHSLRRPEASPQLNRGHATRAITPQFADPDAPPLSHHVHLKPWHGSVPRPLPARLLEASDLHERNAQSSPRSTAFRSPAFGDAVRCILARRRLIASEGATPLRGTASQLEEETAMSTGASCAVGHVMPPLAALLSSRRQG